MDSLTEMLDDPTTTGAEYDDAIAGFLNIFSSGFSNSG